MVSIDRKNYLILFNGDSITDGARRNTIDCNHLMGHGYAEMLAGRLGLFYAERMPRFYNRGVAGQRIAHMAEKWEKDVYPYAPDLISILIGANDASPMAKDFDGCFLVWRETYRRLLCETQERLPQTRFVLMEPFMLTPSPLSGAPYRDIPHPDCAPYYPWPAFQMTLAEQKARMRVTLHMAETVRAIAEEFSAVFVPLQKPLEALAKRSADGYAVWDGVHPTNVGHALIADLWLEATGLCGKENK